MSKPLRHSSPTARVLGIPHPAFALALLGLVIGLGLNAGSLPDSPGRWQPDAAHAVALEQKWIRDYLTVHPQVGDHISSKLYVALAEGEHAWAAMYIGRQRAALSRALARRSSDASGVSNTVQMLVQGLALYGLPWASSP